MKLIITDWGDPSVGIWIISYEINCPFEKPDPDVILLDDDFNDLEWFRQQQIDIYKEYAQGKLTAAYDFELQIDDDVIQDACYV